jgi:hypothetical protein
MGNSGIRLKIPLTATGSTAPEANLETAVGSKRAVPPRASATSGAHTHVEGRGCSAPERTTRITRITLELSSTAEAAPPTYPTKAAMDCSVTPPTVAPGRNTEPRQVASTESKETPTACLSGEGRAPSAPEGPDVP